MKWLKRRKADRRARISEQGYRDGLFYVMTAYYIDGKSIDDIDAKVDCGKYVKGIGPFELGARLATDLIASWKGGGCE